MPQIINQKKENFMEELVHITKSKIMSAKNKTGTYIKFEFTIIDGKYKGQKIWTRMNITNPKK